MPSKIRDEYRRTLQVSRALVSAILIVSLGACGLLERSVEPEPEPPTTPIEAPQSGLPVAQVGSIGDALQWIESGNYAQALRLLEQLYEEQPDAPTVRLLLRQLREPPESLVPGPYREVELAPGESLSAVAERELGNPLYFLALARLNSIDEPRRIVAGTRLRVPQQAVVRAPVETALETALETESGDEAVEQDLLTVADYLVASGQIDQALNLMLATLRDRGGSERLQSRFTQLGLERVDRWSAERRHDAAAAWLRIAGVVVTEPVLVERLDASARQIEMRRLLEQAEGAAARGDLDEAFTGARQALELEPDDLQAQKLERLLRVEWTEQLHEDALRSWRERDVDQSIRLWQRLLADVPDFEPARIYLERALELRRRLQ